MKRSVLAASALSAAIGFALAVQAPARAAAMPPIVKQNMMKAHREHLEKCYGVNAVAKNDCAEGAHSCAGQATVARDPASFVLLPAGDCGKIAGGSLQAR
ncbi:MAG: BufA1 family periplasmic bufferin-type metallophore [Steroidobacteraceae bacterium]